MLTRRSALQLISAGAGLSSLVPWHGASAQGRGLGTDYDVVVVGGGVAGLVAAKRLTDLGAELKVLVLEARDRLGGRVHSIRRDALNRDVELGAMYLPKGLDKDWAPISELGLMTESLGEGATTLYPGMGALVRGLAESSLGTVQLNSTVIDVFWREGLVGVNYRNRGLDGAVTARRMVVTVPAGVLRSGGPVFTPDLGAEKKAVLASIGIERGISCAMIFPASATALKPSLSPWIQRDERSELRAFRAGQEGEVLLEAQFMGSRADALKGQPRDLVASLALRGFQEALTNIPMLSEARWFDVTDWDKEPLSRGAIPRRGSTVEHITLAQSIQGTLFFAGDATAERSRVGTLRGAYDSGERVAREVALSLDAELLAPDANEPIMELL